MDGWRASAQSQWLALVEQPVKTSATAPHDLVRDLTLPRWASFCAATAEWLCQQDQFPFPAWTGQEVFRLDEPWFLYPGELLKPWQLATTPVPFKMRNIFGVDQLLGHV